MYRNFDPNTTTINVSKEMININKKDGTVESTEGIRVRISSDFGDDSYHKSILDVNEKNLSSDIKYIWDAVKKISNKIISVKVWFEEIDYYDNMINIYTTPVISIEKGQRIAHISKKEHGSIPRDWEITLTSTFEKCQRIAPIISLVEEVLGPYFTSGMMTDFENIIRPVLQGKTPNVSFNISNN